MYVVEGARSHGCESMPDSVNVSETQPSMAVHATLVHIQAKMVKNSFLVCALLIQIMQKKNRL